MKTLFRNARRTFEAERQPEMTNAETRWENEGGASYAHDSPVTPPPQRTERIPVVQSRGREPQPVLVIGLLVFFMAAMVVLTTGSWAHMEWAVDAMRRHAIVLLAAILVGFVVLWALLRHSNTHARHEAV